jgi:hypothetical protein
MAYTVEVTMIKKSSQQWISQAKPYIATMYLDWLTAQPEFINRSTNRIDENTMTIHTTYVSEQAFNDIVAKRALNEAYIARKNHNDQFTSIINYITH